MAATIKDVAKETGLSIATISKYMNGGQVLPKNKNAIEKAFKKLKYFPNDSARALKTSRTYTIGVVCGIGWNPHSAELIGYLERIFTTKGYNISLVTYGEVGKEDSGKKIERQLQFLVDSGVDGLIMTPVGTEKYLWNFLSELKIPIVLLESNGVHFSADCVQVNCTGGSYDIVEYLIQMRHRKIAILAGPSYKLTASERVKGYCRAFEDYNLPVQKEYIIEGDYTAEEGYRGFMKLWNMKERPTAVFASNYHICIGMMEAVNELGIQIPDDISLVTFDDFLLSEMVQPHLTSIRQPLREMAEESSELLLRRIEGDYSDYPVMKRIKPKCIYRESVSKCKEN